MLAICIICVMASFDVSFCQSEFLLSAQSEGKSCRTVVGEGPAHSQGKFCQFPFTFSGVVRTGCISDTDPAGRLWCSTRVDGDGVHVGQQGHWGYCPPGCSTTSQDFVEAPTSLSCVRRSGEAGECVPPAGCVGVDFSQIDRDRCSLPSGDLGLCCQSHTKNNIVNFSSDQTSTAVRVPPISFGEIDSILDEVIQEEQVNIRFGSTNRNRVSPNSITPVVKSPSFFHHKFNSPRKEIVDIDKEASKLLKVTKRLKELKNLTDSQASVGLRSGFNSVTSQRISRLCPWTSPGPVCDGAAKFRTMDGTCNNLRQPNYGRTGTPFQRILLPEYAKGSVDLPRKRNGDGRELPSAREISNRMAGGRNAADSENTLLLMQMGQFIDHDITHTPNYAEEDKKCCRSDGKFPSSFSSEKCFPLRISHSDKFWQGVRTCMEFSRSLSSPGLQCELQHREQTNQITHWLDGSNIYGSSAEEAAALRDSRGRLKVSRSRRGSRDNLPSCSRPGAGDIKACETCEGDDEDCFFAGDFRVNEQINLVVVHTLFLREHNRVARQLELSNPSWSDEKLYQEARRITVAQYQHIVYNEWLPVILGNNFMRTFGLFPLSSGHSQDYDDSFDPRINNEFAAAAFRFGHSLVPKNFLSIDSNRQQHKVMNLKEVFFQPKEMKKPGFFDNLLRGLMDEKAKAADSSFVEELRNHLFEKENGGGLDLVAMNIQRGRDHGLPGYNKYRQICMGSKADTWTDLRSSILPEHITSLQRMYKSIDDVDLFVGGFLEQPHQDSLVGPLFKCIIGDQFARLKKGDRFFYDLGIDSNIMFSTDELQEIRKSNLARLICDNSDVKRVQPLVLKLPISSTNALRSCEEESIPRLNLNVFNRNKFR